jgi:hypothetical protein
MNEKLTLKLQHKDIIYTYTLKRLYRGAPVYFLLAECNQNSQIPSGILAQ